MFIIGSGRSGSSALHEFMAYHPRAGWMSRLCEKKPNDPSANRRVLRAMRFPIVGGYMRRYYSPNECYRFFDISYPGFSSPVRDLHGSDLTARAARQIRERLLATVPEDREVLIVKFTGWPRIGFLAALFPDARFVHLVRDGRAVANSLLQVPWWHGWRGPGNWRFGPLSAEDQATWEAHDRSFPALAAIEWKLIVNSLEQARSEIDPRQIIDVRYEDLCSDSLRVIRRVVDHAGLSWVDALETDLRRDPFESRNPRWREDLGPGNAAIVNEVLRDVLPRFDYEPDPAMN